VSEDAQLPPDIDRALFEEVYLDLKQRARALRRGQGSHTLDTTALVHESFLKLTERRAQVNDRAHLFRLAALAMRQVLIDHLRERQADKRGGQMQRVDLTDVDLPEDDPALGLSLVTQSLERLRALDPRLADVFSLRAFAGLGFEDIGAMLAVSRSTAQRDFEAARAYLLTTLT
jgi:RNA polymerase sigma factor (TIGR02999 family)